VILAVTLMAANGAAMSIRERRHEIAILRAMGFAPTVVLSSLLTENTILAIGGGGFGSLAVIVLELGVTPSIPGLPEGVVVIPGAILMLAMVLSALIGMVGALVPAGFAVRSNISQALRAV
jgi:putative ABC transport system permease protein